MLPCEESLGAAELVHVERETLCTTVQATERKIMWRIRLYSEAAASDKKEALKQSPENMFKLKSGATKRAPGNSVSGKSSMMFANDHAWIYTQKFKNSSFSFLISPRLYLLSTLVCFLPLPGQSHSTVTRYLSGNESPTLCNYKLITKQND